MGFQKTIFGTMLTLSIIGGVTRHYLSEKREEERKQFYKNYRPELTKQQIKERKEKHTKLMKENYIRRLDMNRQLVQAFPEKVNYWYDICKINLNLINEYKEGSLEEAIESCEKTLDLEPNDITYLNTMATVYCMANLEDKAKKTFKKIKELDETYLTTSCKK